MSTLNLVKIKNVTLYTAICPQAQECWDCFELLRDNNVTVHHLNYHDDVNASNVFEPLSTWNFFDGEETFKREFDALPIIHWESFYDDEEGPKLNVAVGLNELTNSQLMANLDKVVE